MQTAAKRPSNNYRLILIFSACISLILSARHNNVTHVLSHDSLLYLRTAQAFLDHGLQAAIELYSWPLLSILIAGVHQVTGLTLALSGHMIIALLYAALVCAFVSLVRDLGGSSKTQLLAMLVIIIFPTLNDYRSYITRDIGYWLLTLLSLQQLLRFALHTHFKHAVGWFIFTLAAIGFRTEAIFFAVLSPLAILFDYQLSTKQRFKMTGILYGLFSCVAIVALIIIFTIPALSGKLRLFSELLNIGAFFQQLSLQLEQTISNFAALAHHKYFAEDMGIIFISGLIGLVLYTILHALALPYLVLLCWQPRKKLFKDPRQKTYLIAYALIIISYLMLLSFKKYFITDRFCLTAVLIIMLALPFCIENIWDKDSITQRRFSWQKILIVMLLLYPALDSLITSGNSKKYIADAAEWVSTHKPADTRFVTNYEHIAVIGANCWHSCFKAKSSTIVKQAQQQTGLIAIRLRHKEQAVFEEINVLLASSDWSLLQSFSNEVDDKVLILARDYMPDTTQHTD